MGQVLQGVVKWFNDAKGFGFIEHESGQDVFVHYSVIDQDGFKTLKDGEAVEYELREGDKGLNASRVSRVNAPKQADEESSKTPEDQPENQTEPAVTAEPYGLNVEVESSSTEPESLEAPTQTTSEEISEEKSAVE